MSEWSEKFDNDDELIDVRISVHDFKLIDRYIDSAIRHHLAESGDHKDDIEFFDCRERLKFIRERLDDLWHLNKGYIDRQRKERKERWSI